MVDRVLNENGLERARAVQVGKSYEIELRLTPKGAKFFNLSVDEMQNLKPTPDLIFQVDKQVFATEEMRKTDNDIYVTRAKLPQAAAEKIVRKINMTIPAKTDKTQKKKEPQRP